MSSRSEARSLGLQWIWQYGVTVAFWGSGKDEWKMVSDKGKKRKTEREGVHARLGQGGIRRCPVTEALREACCGLENLRTRESGGVGEGYPRAPSHPDPGSRAGGTIPIQSRYVLPASLTHPSHWHRDARNPSPLLTCPVLFLQGKR